MKKKLFIIVIAIFWVLSLFAESGGTVDEINRLVREKMEVIKKSGSSLPNVKELPMKKGSAVSSQVSVIDSQKQFNMKELAMTNITGGIFEGGIIGAGCGLIGYAQTGNRDINPLINGAVAGTVSGALLASVLSIVQANTEKYYSSDDYGINLIQWVTAGAAAGAATGYFTYSSLKKTEVITENTGYGIAGGAFIGMVFATVEFFVPSELRGRIGSGRAFITPLNNEYKLVYAVSY